MAAAPTAAEAGALAIFVLNVAAVVALVLRPTSLPLPRTSRRVPLPYWLVPPLGVLVMLAAGTLDGERIIAGIVGDAAIQPFSIIILFESLAYQAAALDATGLFCFIAARAASAARGRSVATLLAYFALASVMTLVTSNDVVTMALTPLVHDFVVASTPPSTSSSSASKSASPAARAYLAAVFTASNVWSIALYVGNPTNVIVAQATGLTFLSFSAWMALPALGIMRVCVFVLVFFGGHPFSPRKKTTLK